MRVFSLFVFSVINSSHSLKLLTHTEANWKGKDWFKGTTQWGSNIMFSAKPILGKCKEVQDEVALMANNVEGYVHESATGNMCVTTVPDDQGACISTEDGSSKVSYLVCYTQGVAYEKARTYIKDVHGTDVTFPKWTEGELIKNAIQAAAELITGSNKAENCKAKPIGAFDFNTADQTVKTYTVAEGKKVTGTGSDNPGYWCFGPAEIAWAKNDPKVRNMDGEEFDIMATGTFELLTLRKHESEKPVISVSSTIDRAGNRCGATYIQNISLTGDWVQDVGVPAIEIRAKPAVSKKDALEVKFGESWERPPAVSSRMEVKEASAQRLTLKLHTIKIMVSVDSHRIQDRGIKTARFANFLNVNFDGISRLSNMAVGGLLGRDSHEAAAAIPDGCSSTSLLGSGDINMLSSSQML